MLSWQVETTSPIIRRKYILLIIFIHPTESKLTPINYISATLFFLLFCESYILYSLTSWLFSDFCPSFLLIRKTFPLFPSLYDFYFSIKLKLLRIKTYSNQEVKNIFKQICQVINIRVYFSHKVAKLDSGWAILVLKLIFCSYGELT